MWPTGSSAPALRGAILMIAAAVGWGIYSLAGRGATDPLRATAVNFSLAAPLALLVWIAVSDSMSPIGLLLAVVSGTVTSGLGYALWYAVLPDLPVTVAAVAQLTVPIIALAAGVTLLGESATLRIAIASVLVLGGVGLSVVARQRSSPATS